MDRVKSILIIQLYYRYIGTVGTDSLVQLHLKIGNR